MPKIREAFKGIYGVISWLRERRLRERAATTQRPDLPPPPEISPAVVSTTQQAQNITLPAPPRAGAPNLPVRSSVGREGGGDVQGLPFEETSQMLPVPWRALSNPEIARVAERKILEPDTAIDIENSFSGQVEVPQYSMPSMFEFAAIRDDFIRLNDTNSPNTTSIERCGEFYIGSPWSTTGTVRWRSLASSFPNIGVIRAFSEQNTANRHIISMFACGHDPSGIFAQTGSLRFRSRKGFLVNKYGWDIAWVARWGMYRIAIPTNGIGRTGNVATVNFATAALAHGLKVGNIVTITGVTDPSFNGTFMVSSVPTTTTFTYINPGPDTGSGGGVVIMGPGTNQRRFVGWGTVYPINNVAPLDGANNLWHAFGFRYFDDVDFSQGVTPTWRFWLKVSGTDVILLNTGIPLDNNFHTFRFFADIPSFSSLDVEGTGGFNLVKTENAVLAKAQIDDTLFVADDPIDSIHGFNMPTETVDTFCGVGRIIAVGSSITNNSSPFPTPEDEPTVTHTEFMDFDYAHVAWPGRSLIRASKEVRPRSTILVTLFKKR